MSTLNEKLEGEVNALQEIQRQYNTAILNRQQLDSQLRENEAVKEEFAALKSESVVYKLIGPVLVKQDLVEAKSNVDKRLEFINGEIKRAETLLKDLTNKQEKRQEQILKLKEMVDAQESRAATS
ncbi:Prefoldin [Gonapodya prolifera JEL478]|uniref:Prefoldin n=1 Tax=Gonapodya prolifera (strain JEL478) TaxID=1344416 RepID=A0A139ALD1_GONPJ|nr:Prefoldin [Gonapodya prolifera JEL478]|eukprot:KXS17560.1 Prefoldin [Gonapodya prolifera JEL478]